MHEFKKENNRLPTGEELRRHRFHINNLEWSSNTNDLLQDFSSWISQRKREKNILSGTVDIYGQTYSYLSKFVGVERKYDIKRMEYKNYQFGSITDVNLSFLNEFKNWLSNQTSRSTKMNLSNTTINKQIRNLTQFLRERSKQGESVSADVFNVELDKRNPIRAYLTESEIDKIKYVKLTERGRRRLEIIKDMFILNLFFGLRVSDLFALTKHDIFLSEIPKDNYLFFFSKKGQKQVKLPILSEESVKVILKYMDDSRDKLFPAMSIATFNKNLRKLAGMQG